MIWFDFMGFGQGFGLLVGLVWVAEVLGQGSVACGGFGVDEG